MRLKIWGCRGSVPTPGPDTVEYGGNTSCVEIRADETDSDPLDVSPDAARTPATPSITLPSHAAWLLAIVFGVSALTTSTTAVHVFPFLLADGYTAHSAALGVATLGAAQVPARLVFVPISKVLPKPKSNVSSNYNELRSKQ